MLQSENPSAKEPVEEVALSSKTLANVYFRDGKPGRAFAHLLVCLELKKEWAEELEPLFVDTLTAWGKTLEDKKQFNDLFNCYEQAITIYPENIDILMALGACLYRANYLKEALKYFQLAAYKRSNYLPAWNGVENVKNILVERWHFRMLNDNKRNTAFNSAIQKCSQLANSKVLDIGAGTGLLSLFAAESNASFIYACDYSEAMTDIADSVFKANGLSDRAVILKKLSTEICIPDDIPERVPIVVTETFDAALFGEHILETAIHAWESLLVREKEDGRKGIFLPMKAKVFGCLVESIEIARKHHLLPEMRSVKQEFSLCVDCLRPYDSTEYDTENLRTISGGFKLLSEPFNLFEVDFNDPDDLKMHYEGSKSKRRFNVPCVNSGYVDAVAVWFELLVDGENVVLCNSPLSRTSSCWEQAIFPSCKSTLLETGQEIEVNSSCEKGKLTVNWRLQSQCDQPVVPASRSAFWNVSQPVIRYLNNKRMLQTLQVFVDKLKLDKRAWQRVVDTSPFPVLGFLLAQNTGSHLTVCRKNNDDFKSIASVLMNNGLSESSVSTQRWLDFLSNQPKEQDVIFVSLVSSTGELDGEMIEHIESFRKCLKKDGMLLPKKLCIYCQVVESDFFLNSSQVTNKNLKKYKIPELINKYQVQHHIDVNLNSISYIPLTPVIPLARFHLSRMESGRNYNFSSHCHITKPGRVNAIIYWFAYDLGRKCKWSTYTRDSDCNQAAAVMHDQRYVNKGTELHVNLQYLDGILKFEIN